MTSAAAWPPIDAGGHFAAPATAHVEQPLTVTAVVGADATQAEVTIERAARRTSGLRRRSVLTYPLAAAAVRPEPSTATVTAEVRTPAWPSGGEEQRPPPRRA